LITGGASGLGKAIAQRFKTEGARVIITDIDRSSGEVTARECDFSFLEQDVSNEARWSEVIGEVETRFGALNILVNNAGILGPVKAASPEDTPFANWKKVFAVNVDSVFLGCQAAIPAMRRAGGGCIINVSSIAGLLASPHATAYGASKAAVTQLTKSVAQHCAQQRLHIRCNSLHPGNVMTGLWDNYAAEVEREQGVSAGAFIKEATAGIPLGDFTRVEDVAAAAAYLASDDARHVTGTQLVVDGGVVGCDTFEPK
jgi:3(or 17)beta-hydroxysteroid dehydrogenase